MPSSSSLWPVVTTQRLLQVPLAAVLPFLEGALRAAGERRRNASVIKSLRKAENLQCREAAIRCRQRYVSYARQTDRRRFAMLTHSDSTGLLSLLMRPS